MKVGKIFSKAMVDKDIVGSKNLSLIAGISYEKTLRIMSDQSSAKMVDVNAVAKCLGLQMQFVPVSGDICTTTNET